MRLGINCCDLYEKHAGGIRQYFARLVNRLLTDGHEECVLLHLSRNTECLDELLIGEWRRHAVELGSARSLNDLFTSLDVYFCPTGTLRPRPLPIASVVTLVDIQETYFPQFFSVRERWGRLYHHPASTRLADRVITLSEFSKQGIAGAHRIAASKIHVAYLAPDDDHVDDAVAAALLPKEVPERFLFYPANFWPHKNHDRLLRALALARDDHGVRMPCVFTGVRVPRGYDIAAGVARHRLDGQVRFLGYQPSRVMAALYRHAAALVFPSLFEGFGLPVVEAMAAGCPVACSNTTSLPEVAGDAATYVSPQDPADIARALIALWTNDHLRADLARKGRIRVKRFSTDAMVGCHRQAFQAACGDFARHGSAADPWLRDLLVAGWCSLRPRAAPPER